MSSSKITERNIADSVFEGLAQEESVQAILNAVQSGGSVIKGVQRGVITLPTGRTGDTPTATATINAVNLNKSIVLYTGVGITSTSVNSSYGEMVELELTNATTVTAKHTTDVDVEKRVPYQVIEFY